MSEPTPEQCEALRTAFLQDLEKKGEDSVHPKDLVRIKQNDDWLRRFLLHHDLNQTEALKMLWETVTWRKDFKTNEITEDNVKVDILAQGGFFPYGKDIDGRTLLVFKCKKHTKGNVEFADLERCVIYWFERVERQCKGQPITLFFDMEGCGLSNMDMEFTKYLIGLFKVYYPYFLNYILIFEMPWVLSAAFKIIKSWLPEKAVQKIKFVSKKDITTYIPQDQVLSCWGGPNTYTFSFVPETPEKIVPQTTPVTANSKKVHFVDAMSEISASSGEKETVTDGGCLKVHPSSTITFVQEGSELFSTLELQNADSSVKLSYKLKTTSPEKFRVRPSVGILGPGSSATVTVTLLPGFQLGGLSRDKFLVMSTPVDSLDLSGQELSDLWRDTAGKKIHQHRLKCIQSGDITKNGNAVSVPASTPEHDANNVNKLSATVAQLSKCQTELHKAVKRTQYFQLATIVLILTVAIVLGYALQTGLNSNSNHSYCRNPNSP